MQIINTPSSSVCIKEKKIVGYFKGFLKSYKKNNLIDTNLNSTKKAPLKRDQLFTEIKSLLDDL